MWVGFNGLCLGQFSSLSKNRIIYVNTFHDFIDIVTNDFVFQSELNRNKNELAQSENVNWEHFVSFNT